MPSKLLQYSKSRRYHYTSSIQFSQLLRAFFSLSSDASRVIYRSALVVTRDVNCAQDLWPRRFTTLTILLGARFHLVRDMHASRTSRAESRLARVNNHGTVLVGRSGVGGKCSPLGRGGEMQLLSRIYSSPESISALLSRSLFLPGPPPSPPPCLSSPFISGTRQGGA